MAPQVGQVVTTTARRRAWTPVRLKVRAVDVARLTVLPQLPSQVSNLGLQPRDPVSLRRDKSSKLLP
jgi:hypothetical protein